MEIVSRESNVAALPRTSRDGAFPQAFDIPNPDVDDAVVYLIECPRSFGDHILAFLAEAGITAIAFASAGEYLTFQRKDKAACVILNISWPDRSGLELQKRLAERENPPVIFISEQCDIATTVCAMKAGAVEFLTIPLNWATVGNAVSSAFMQDRRRRHQKAELSRLQERLSFLTPREREVLPLIVGGLLNKQAASVLGISEVTLQIHRSQIMRKMRAESFADLVRMAVKLRIRYWREGHRSDGERDVAPELHSSSRN